MTRDMIFGMTAEDGLGICLDIVVASMSLFSCPLLFLLLPPSLSLYIYIYILWKYQDNVCLLYMFYRPPAGDIPTMPLEGNIN